MSFDISIISLLSFIGDGMGFVAEIAQQGKVTVLHEGAVLAAGKMSEIQADERVIEVYLGR